MRLLRAFTDRKKSPLPEPVSEMLLVAGEEVSLTFKRHAAARRFTLRLSRDGKGFVMTMPRRASMMDARAFARKSQDWMERALSRRTKPVEVEEGAVIMLRGVEHRIVATGKARGHVVHDAEAKLIHVPGAPNHMRRRLLDWLKAEAAHDLDVASTKYALAMGTSFRKLNVRDQKSRWGSCSTDGVLNYSWRLVLAPGFVLDYVAAHEVAHLREMNHSFRFWRLVLKHCPDSHNAKVWLKLYGNRLHALR
ncbi:M48 family metallopeptidase [Aestuariivirga sp.]|uniref:M48 family metallopeptidase n=1 Tax=Aestuariivirga sp. TaxID=2650926 RepID=UPI0039E34337